MSFFISESCENNVPVPLTKINLFKTVLQYPNKKKQTIRHMIC